MSNISLPSHHLQFPIARRCESPRCARFLLKFGSLIVSVQEIVLLFLPSKSCASVPKWSPRPLFRRSIWSPTRHHDQRMGLSRRQRLSVASWSAITVILGTPSQWDGIHDRALRRKASGPKNMRATLWRFLRKRPNVEAESRGGAVESPVHEKDALKQKQHPFRRSEFREQVHGQIT